MRTFPVFLSVAARVTELRTAVAPKFSDAGRTWSCGTAFSPAPFKGTLTVVFRSELESTSEPLVATTAVGAKTSETGKLIPAGSVKGVFAAEKLNPWPVIWRSSKLTASWPLFVTRRVCVFFSPTTTSPKFTSAGTTDRLPEGSAALLLEETDAQPATNPVVANPHTKPTVRTSATIPEEERPSRRPDTPAIATI